MDTHLWDGRHIVEHRLDLARAVGAPPNGRRTELAIRPQDAQAVEQRLWRSGPTQNLRVVLAPGAGGPAYKRWPPAHFAAVGDALVREFNAAVLVVGMPADHDAVAAVLRAAREPIHDAADLDPAAVIARCRLVVSNDTGTMHVARALGVPTVTIRGLYRPGDAALWGYDEPDYARLSVRMDRRSCRPRPLCAVRGRGLHGDHPAGGRSGRLPAALGRGRRSPRRHAPSSPSPSRRTFYGKGDAPVAQAGVTIQNLGSGADENLRQRARFLRYFRGCRRVLDLGGGVGGFAALLAGHGTEVVCVDASAEAVAACCRLGLAAHCADAVEFLEGRAAEFDGVWCAHLIEHLDPSRAQRLLDGAARVLRPGGILVLLTPNAADVAVMGETFWEDPAHVRPYPKQLLRGLAAAAGLGVEELGETPPGWLKSEPFLKRLVLRGRGLLARALVGRHFHLGDVYLVARKGEDRA